MKFVHAADLHLDSPLLGLERYPGAPVEAIRSASRHACERLVELCQDEQASLLLIAGDLYDGDWRDFSTGLFFVEQMLKLQKAGIKVALIRGNHDAQSKITKALRLPDNVCELPVSAPGSAVYEELGLAVHGQGFATARVEHDLVPRFPAPLGGLLNIGLLHTGLDGRAGHAPYAPCSLRRLIDFGYDYWALGHVHSREVLSRDPWVVYPGNLQGRHARELGPKGASLVSVEDGRITRVEHRPLDVVRWDRCQVDVDGLSSLEEVLERATRALEHGIEQADGRWLAARVHLSGTCPAHVLLSEQLERLYAELYAAALDLGNVFIERVQDDTSAPLDLGKLRAQDDALGMLARFIDQQRQVDEADAAALFADLRQKLPMELQTTSEGLALDDPGLFLQLLSDVEQLLLPRILRRDELGQDQLGPRSATGRGDALS